MAHLLTFAFLLASIGIARAEQVEIAGQLFTLPEGFVHRPGQGIDSSPGRFNDTNSAFEIFYDIGIGAHYGGNEGIRKRHEDRVVQQRVIKTAAGDGLLLVLGPGKRSAFFGIEGIGYFKAKIAKDEDLRVFIEIVSSVQFSDEAKAQREKPDSRLKRNSD